MNILKTIAAVACTIIISVSLCEVKADTISADYDNFYAITADGTSYSRTESFVDLIDTKNLNRIIAFERTW